MASKSKNDDLDRSFFIDRSHSIDRKLHWLTVMLSGVAEPTVFVTEESAELLEDYLLARAALEYVILRRPLSRPGGRWNPQALRAEIWKLEKMRARERMLAGRK